MKPTRWTAAIAILATTSFITPMLVPTLAAAQPTKKPEKHKGLRDSLSGEARDAFDRAVTLYSKAKNPAGALAEFERAYTLSKDPRLLQNMAVCERDLKRYSRAISLLNRELAEKDDFLTASDQSDVKSQIDSLAEYTAPLTITCNESGAKVLIDDVEVGQTPLDKPVTVDVGEHKVVVRKEGFLDFSKTQTTSAKTPVTVTAKLDPTVKKGKLGVRISGPAGASETATVRLDGIDVGAAPWEGDVAVGKHTIEIRARGYVTEVRNETIEYQQSRTIELALRIDQGTATIETNSDKNQIIIDDKPVAKGRWEGPLTTGSHQLVVTRDGYESANQVVTVQTDQPQTIRITLKAKGGVAWYWWVIGGAVVVGGGIGIYAATRPKTQDPQPGTLNPGVAPVGFHF